MVMPFMSIYMYTQMGIPMTMVGLAFFIGTVMGAVASYVGGTVCDRYGRKKVFIAGLTMQVVSLLLISMAIDSKASYWPLVAVLAIGQIIDGLYRPVPDIMIADLVEPGRRIGAYGLIRVGGNIGAVIGPVMGGALALVAMSYSSMFYIAALTTFIFLLVVIFKLQGHEAVGNLQYGQAREIGKIAGDRPFLLFCLFIMLLIIPYSQMYVLMSVYSSAYLGMNTLEVGGIFAVSGIMVALFHIPDHHGDRPIPDDVNAGAGRPGLRRRLQPGSSLLDTGNDVSLYGHHHDSGNDMGALGLYTKSEPGAEGPARPVLRFCRPGQRHGLRHRPAVRRRAERLAWHQRPVHVDSHRRGLPGQHGRIPAAFAPGPSGHEQRKKSKPREGNDCR